MRKTVCVAGESGMGIESSGLILLKALKDSGFWVFGEREFPSLIKGGRSSFNLNLADEEISSNTQKVDVGLVLDREGLLEVLDKIRDGGVILNGFERWNKVVKNLPDLAKQKGVELIQIPARSIAQEQGGGIVMTNTVLLGVLWKVLNLDIQVLNHRLASQFAHKPEILEVNSKCLLAGFNFSIESDLTPLHTDIFNMQSKIRQNGWDLKNHLVIDGNSAISLGSIVAGVKNYYAYPMSPSSSILSTMADLAFKYGLVVKQVEDEITAVQMAMGSSFMGSRSFTATSGGGFDLMTETVSLSAMMEIPLVIVLSQRPGPATGLPTWTGQGDLDLAIYGGHGEFARLVLAVSDIQSCYTNIQKAFDLAEKYQIPTILLTEAGISMSYFTSPELTQNLPIQRHLTDPNQAELQSSDRYKITETGISKRWLPASGKVHYFSNGDEHWSGGELTEDGEKVKQMQEKRNLKLKTLKIELPEPEMFGQEKAKICLVGWGSVKNVALDALKTLQKEGIECAYLHYDFLWPLKSKKLTQIFQSGKKVILIEANYNGQLGKHLEAEIGYKFSQKFLKYNGRSIFIEELVDYIKTLKFDQTKTISLN